MVLLILPVELSWNLPRWLELQCQLNLPSCRTWTCLRHIWCAAHCRRPAYRSRPRSSSACVTPQSSGSHPSPLQHKHTTDQWQMLYTEGQGQYFTPTVNGNPLHWKSLQNTLLYKHITGQWQMLHTDGQGQTITLKVKILHTLHERLRLLKVRVNILQWRSISILFP